MNLKQMILPFFAGVAAGAAAGYYLNSDKGREQVDQAKEMALETKERAQEQISGKMDQMHQQMNHTLHNMQQQIDQMKAAGKAQLAQGQEMISHLSEQGLDQTIAAADSLKKKAEEAKRSLSNA